jgi:hypothetical protein
MDNRAFNLHQIQICDSHHTKHAFLVEIRNRVIFQIKQTGLDKMSRTFLAISVITSITATSANASNVDVNDFFHKAETAVSAPSDRNAFNEAVNAYDNLNARDKMVVDGIADKTSLGGTFADIKGSADSLGHSHISPEGWNPAKTQAFIAASHTSPVNAAPVTPTTPEEQAALQRHFADLRQAKENAENATFETKSREAQNRLRTAEQHPDYAAVQAKVDADTQTARDDAQDSAINTAQTTADSAVTKADAAQYTANTAHLAADAVKSSVYVAQKDIDQNAADIKSNADQIGENTSHIDTNTKAIAGTAAQVNTNTDNIKTNSDEIATVKGSVSGVAAQVAADHSTNTAKNDEQDKEIANQGVALLGKVDNATYSHDKLTQAIIDGDQATQIKTNADSISQTADNLKAVAGTVQGQQLAQANRDRTASQHVTEQSKAVAGADGKDGANGKDGVTTTITKVETDTNTQSQVKQNSVSIRSITQTQKAQGDYVQAQSQVINQHSAAIRNNSAQIERNSAQINKNKQDIEDTRQDLKRGLNNAAAMTGLHYHSNDSYAVSAGTSNGDGAAIAGGLSHSITEHTAATVQASTSMDGGWMASVGFSGDF